MKRPDRQELDRYLRGEIDTSKRIDKYARLEEYIPYKRVPDEKPAAKRPRVDAAQSAQDREAEKRRVDAKFDAKDNTATVSTDKLT